MIKTYSPQIAEELERAATAFGAPAEVTKLWVPRTVSRPLTSAFADSQPVGAENACQAPHQHLRGLQTSRPLPEAWAATMLTVDTRPPQRSTTQHPRQDQRSIQAEGCRASGHTQGVSGDDASSSTTAEASSER